MRNWILVILTVFSFQLLATPAEVLIIRHAEKPDDSPDLSPEGYLHAQKLVNYFRTNPKVLRNGLPVALYAMEPKHDGGSRRAIETLGPLATALGLEINTQFSRDELPGLVADVMSHPELDGKTVLICWEHKVIPDLAAQFGVSPTPEKWHGSDYLTVYRIDFTTDGRVRDFKEFAQTF